MNCFRHRDQPSVGICKACMKGVCGECVVEIEGSLACKGSCEKRVIELHRIQKNQVSLQKFSMAARILSPLMLIAYGLYVVVYWSGWFYPARDMGLTGIGAISLAIGVAMALRTFRKTGGA